MVFMEEMRELTDLQTLSEEKQCNHIEWRKQKEVKNFTSRFGLVEARKHGQRSTKENLGKEKNSEILQMHN